ncbi:Helicase domain protein [Candidatus Rhodobacter oscarellae]|uniref:Helicase domain protein n=1 Tax=Candidatus Rhodobacter oscarellae TaxID=1675527 RepID=A0A0J9GV50_9RHOB|nr:DEAD/DEAH box helicase [Candidatus Rhodobacter lobularis]KMW57453.1 Helicase domain protein [Candidatus Rhodobacter lobularis]
MKKTIADVLARKGYDSLTPVQQAVSEPELQGRDLLVSAQTGSGKTVAFGLAIAPTLLGDEDRFGPAGHPLALIIAPTRELALQVKRELGWLYADAGASLASCVGGMDMRDERRALARGAHLVVATPGRLRDHIMRGSIDLTNLRSVVLDEADEMLDLGFREDLEFILEATPQERQTLLFSATVPSSIAALARSYQRDAERISTIGDKIQHADIDYRAMMVAARDGENAVINVLRYYEAPNAIVFCNTRAMVSRLTTRLSNRGFPVVALSGELTQSERSNALQAMRDGRARVCVATDVAARGIDLPKLDLVVHAELPNNHETLLHRSGRTGRAGRKGVSALVVVPAARNKTERLLRSAKLKAEWGAAPSATDVHARDQDRMLAADDWQLAITESERDSVEKLVEQFTPEQIAAAYIRQYKLRHSPPEELGEAVHEPRKPREPFGASVWFSVSEGRNHNASPRHLLPMICKAGNITKTDIGAIRITDEQSFVEIRETSVDDFLAAIGPGMKIEGSKRLARLDKAPELSDARGAKPERRFEKSPQQRPEPRPESRPDSRPEPRKSGKPFADRNDAAEPRRSKPKPEDRKPTKPEERKPRAPKAPKASAPPADAAKKPAPGKRKPPVSHTGPKSKPGKDSAPNAKAGELDPPKRRSEGRSEARKGPPPPKGKPSSKKNRARAATANGKQAPHKK